MIGEGGIESHLRVGVFGGKIEVEVVVGVGRSGGGWGVGVHCRDWGEL